MLHQNQTCKSRHAIDGGTLKHSLTIGTRKLLKWRFYCMEIYEGSKESRGCTTGFAKTSGDSERHKDWVDFVRINQNDKGEKGH